MAKKSSSTRHKTPPRANTFAVSLGPPKTVPAGGGPKAMADAPLRNFQAMQDAIGEKRKPQGPQKFAVKKSAGRTKVSKVPPTSVD